MSEDSSIPPPAPPDPYQNAAGGPPPPPPPSYGGGSGGAASDNRKIFLIVAYLGPLALVPFLIEKNDREVQWHAKHGIVLFLAELALGVVITVANMAASMVLHCLGGVMGCVVGLALFVGLVVLHVTCIMKALNGERQLIPGISQFADQF
jgi:uncharacterized membrane protein